MKKRGYFFTMDAMVAIGVMVVGIVLVLMSMSYQPPGTTAILLSYDLMNTLESTHIYDINDQLYPLIETMKNNSNITNFDNTPLGQIGEFYYRESDLGCTFCKEMASNFTKNLTRYILPEQWSFEILINNETLYRRNSTNPTSEPIKNESRMLVTSRSLFSGIINKTEMWGPYTAEVIVWQ